MRSTPRVSVNSAIPSQPLQAGPGKSVRLHEEAHVLIINVTQPYYFELSFLHFFYKPCLQHIYHRIFRIQYEKLLHSFNFLGLKILFKTCVVKLDKTNEEA